ncbi:MAG: hypothetical protein JXR84_04340 [Anaerolineae bacterium]|nr:hypothetical protein [Anaerolineae bacterium]
MQNRGNRFGISLARQTFQRFNRSRDGVSEAQFFASVERTTPVRPPSLESDVLVPAAVAALIGLGTFMVMTPLALIVFNAIGWDDGVAWFLGIIAGGIGFGVAALDAVFASRTSIYATDVLKDNLLARTERNEETEATASTVDLRVTREDVGPYPQILERSLPVDEGRLRAFAMAIIEPETTIAQADWVGREKLFSRSEFDATLQRLMELGLVAWNSTRDASQGRHVTRGGRAALQAWLEGKTAWGEQGAHASTHASSNGVVVEGEESLE